MRRLHVPDQMRGLQRAKSSMVLSFFRGFHLLVLCWYVELRVHKKGAGRQSAYSPVRQVSIAVSEFISGWNNDVT